MDQDEDLKQALEEEEISAAIDGHGFDPKGFQQGWDAMIQAHEERRLGLLITKEAPIAPENIASFNPMLSKINADFTDETITALANAGIIFVSDLISAPKTKLKDVYDSIPEPRYGKKMTFSNFTAIAEDLKHCFPKTHYFLAQPIKQSESPESAKSALPCRPDGGRDGSGMLI